MSHAEFRAPIRESRRSTNGKNPTSEAGCHVDGVPFARESLDLGHQSQRMDRRDTRLGGDQVMLWVLEQDSDAAEARAVTVESSVSIVPVIAMPTEFRG